MSLQMLKLCDLPATACYALLVSFCLCFTFCYIYIHTLTNTHATHINNIKNIVGLNPFPNFHALFEMYTLQPCLQEVNKIPLIKQLSPSLYDLILHI